MGYSAMDDLFSVKDVIGVFGVATCNARTRSGGLCQNAPMYPAGRCRMHGGKSLRGIASPRFKHGRYCKDAYAQIAGALLADED